MTVVERLSLAVRLRGSWRILLKEISAFGLIGLIALIIDLAIFKELSPHGALKAKCVSTVVSTTVAYFGNRYLSFSHRARTSIGRETGFFFGINLITLGFSELILAVFVYGFDQPHGGIVIQIVNVGTIGLGTIFRFWSYKRFVFLHPDRVHGRYDDVDDELAEA
ncbi:MAG: GtrA family protein [Actinobacteria bacterium]|nr:GtrA family protein [Actinomycetota bacterium]